MAKENPVDYFYTKSHEWLKVEKDSGQCGITDYAQAELTDVVYIELPQTGRQVKQGEKLTVIESVKSVAEIFAPVTGEITEVNTVLSGSPELINADAFGKGWICRIKLTDPAELKNLLSRAAYEQYLKETAH